MSKASKWAQLRPEAYKSLHSKTWANVSEDGRVMLYIQSPGWPDGYISAEPDELLPLARWIIDTFGD